MNFKIKGSNTPASAAKIKLMIMAAAMIFAMSISISQKKLTPKNAIILGSIIGIAFLLRFQTGVIGISIVFEGRGTIHSAGAVRIIQKGLYVTGINACL